MSHLVCSTPHTSSQHSDPQKAYRPNHRATGEVFHALNGKVSPAALAVVCTLAGSIPYDFHRLTAWPTWDTLRKLTGIRGRSSLSRALSELEAGGHIRRQNQGHRKATVYMMVCLSDAYPKAAAVGFIRDADVQANVKETEYQIGMGPVAVCSPESGPHYGPDSGPQCIQSKNNQIKESENKHGRFHPGNRSEPIGERNPKSDVPSPAEAVPDLFQELKTRVEEVSKAKAMHSDSHKSGTVREGTEPRIPMGVQRAAAKFGVHIQPGQTEQDVKALIAGQFAKTLQVTGGAHVEDQQYQPSSGKRFPV